MRSSKPLGPGLTFHEVSTAAIAAARRGRVDVGVHKQAGHSVGLNFPPGWGAGVFLDLRTGNETVLQEGMVFHLPQTMRVGENTQTAMSETVLVTWSGCEMLTDFRSCALIVVD
jgi:Xaa-Pro dipeptidase